MADELAMVKLDGGAIVTVPAGDKAYLIAEFPSIMGKEKKIVPFDKKLIETRIIEALEKAGASAEGIVGSIKDIVRRKKDAQVEEVIGR